MEKYKTHGQNFIAIQFFDCQIKLEIKLTKSDSRDGSTCREGMFKNVFSSKFYTVENFHRWNYILLLGLKTTALTCMNDNTCFFTSILNMNHSRGGGEDRGQSSANITNTLRQLNNF